MVQSAVRGWIARRDFATSQFEKIEDVVCVQTAIRAAQAHASYKRTMDAAVCLQAFARAMLTRRSFRELVSAVTFAQARVRGNCCMSSFVCSLTGFHQE